MIKDRETLSRAYDNALVKATAFAMTNVYGKSADERSEIRRLYNEAMHDAAKAASALAAFDAASNQPNGKE